MSEIMRDFLTDKRQSLSRDRAVFAWKRLQPHFGQLRPVDITRQSCREYAAMRRRRVKDGTIIKELATLRAALRWHDPNTPATIEMPRQPAPRDRYLTRDEYRALREAAAPTPHCQLFIVVAYSTAGRAGAILELIWDRVNFTGEGIIRLATEDEHGNKGRATVPMTTSCRLALQRAREAATTDYVIEFGGKPVRSVRKAFRAACARAGLVDVTPHVLRHTAAVHMAESGIPIPEIAQYLGHRDSRTTERIYARYSPDYLRRAARALE
jgi:integrase